MHDQAVCLVLRGAIAICYSYGNSHLLLPHGVWLIVYGN